MVGKAMNIKTVEFDVTLNNLTDFEEYWSETFYIRGNPWALNFKKCDFEEDEVKRSSLAGYLHTKLDTPLKDWVIVANYSVKIYSNKYNGKLVLIDIEPHSYFKADAWGVDELIKWDELMDPERGYVANDMCKIGINVTASPLQFPNDGKLLEFVPVLKCCDATSRGEFQIKVNEVYNFFDICSPEFTLKHFSWRLLVCKSVTLKKKEFLQVQLYNPSLNYEKKESCKVKLLCKLVPFETTFEELSKSFKNKEFTNDSSDCDLNIISWNELMNPQKKFIQKNSFVLQITIEVTETTKREAARALKPAATDDILKVITWECPICFGSLADKPLSVLICGHLFCTACISLSLERKRNCPSCNRDIPEGDLQKVYLPTK